MGRKAYWCKPSESRKQPVCLPPDPVPGGKVSTKLNLCSARLEHIRVRAGWDFRRAQAAEEGEPLPCVRDEAHSAVAVIGHVLRLGLALDPEISSRPNLFETDL